MIDVLLPFHRVDPFFDQALESLAESRNVKIRLVLIDDSVRQSFEPSSYRNRFHQIELARTGGATGYGNALKIGSGCIDSEVVGLFNSDDLIHPTKFEKQLRALVNHDLSITGIGRIDSLGRKSKFLTGDINSDFYHPILLLLGAYGANATWLMQREWWARNAFFDSHPALDWRIALRGFRDAEIHWNPEKLYFYRQHKYQVTAMRTHKVDELEDVFTEWMMLAEILGIDGCSKEIFSTFALPWLRDYTQSTTEIRDWAFRFLERAHVVDNSTFGSVQALVQRRLLFTAMRAHRIDLAQIQMLMTSIPQAAPLLGDLIGQQIVHFRKSKRD